jgi:tetratricopeptide (TPR) repeat protein
VAVGLALLRDAVAVPRQRPSPTPSRASDLSSWLNSLSRDDLVALVCDQIVEDDDWRRRLELRAAAAASDLPAVSARVQSMLRSDDEYGQSRFAGQYGYLEGPESWYYARRVRQVTETVRQIADAGHAGDAIVIAEMALAAIADSSRDASDRAGVISAAAAELAAAHQEACRATASDPVRLADFLAARMMSANDAEPVDPGDYADLLGSEGMEHLRERITEAWTTSPSGWPERLAMESILRLQGDVDGLVAVLAENLDGRGLGHLLIVRELDQAGRADEALAWAERGLREATEPNERLADFVTDRYMAEGRVSDAVTIRRDRFQAAPRVSSSELLRDAVGLAGAWPMSAKDVASDDQWLRLANLVIETRPADALTVYRRLIAILKGQTGDGVYERIAQLLVSARTCHRRLGTDAAFDLYLRALRDDQKRKRKLIRILDAHRLR